MKTRNRKRLLVASAFVLAALLGAGFTDADAATRYRRHAHLSHWALKPTTTSTAAGDKPTTTSSTPSTVKSTTTTVAKATTTTTATPTTVKPTSGGGWPDASNTGVPAGTALTTVEGGLTVTQDNAVVENKLVKGGIEVSANNVTIRNVRVYGAISIRNWEGPTNLVITDTEIGPASGYIDADLIGSGSFSCIRCNIHSTLADGFKFNSSGKAGDPGVTVQDSFLHDFKYVDGAHNDGAQTMGTGKAVLRHNTINGANETSGGGGLASGIMVGDEQGTLSNITIDNNLFENIGNYALYGGWNQNTGTQPSNMTVTNNVFLKGSFGYGPAVYIAPSTTWSNNTYTTGEALAKP